MEFHTVFLFACLLANVKANGIDNCGFTMYATCDDNMKLFADQTLLKTSNNWRITSAVEIPSNTQTIEIHCSDGWILGGILASSDNGIKTNGTWECSSDNGSTWEPAHELAPNGVASPNISSDAMWIWTKPPTWTQYSNHTGKEHINSAICKMDIDNMCTTTPISTTSTTTTTTTTSTTTTTTTTTTMTTTNGDFTMHATCGGTCDNKMKLFADGNLLASSNDWKKTSPIQIPGDAQSIEIHCQNFWVVGGILASSDNGILTDQTWSCSSDNGLTWASAYEIGPNGMSVPNISTQAKWIWAGRETWANNQNTQHTKVICKIDLETSSSSSSFTPSTAAATPSPVVFGEWSSWSSYSACSATCGIAAKTRKRTCLRLPCRPAVNQQTISCHLPSCGPFVQQKCFLEDSTVTFLDLGHNHMHQDRKPVWNISHEGRRLTEIENTRPSIGLSNLGNPSKPVSFSGKVFSSSSDDDVIGMVFGFWNESNFFVIASSRQSPGPTNWYLGRLHATCGPSCATTTAISDAIWDPSSHPEDITVLAIGSTYWRHGGKYNFTVCFDPAKLLVDVKVTGEDEVDAILESGVISAKTNDEDVDEISRRGGFVGVFVDSQAHTTWNHLNCNDCHLQEEKTYHSAFQPRGPYVSSFQPKGIWHHGSFVWRGGKGGYPGSTGTAQSIRVQKSFQ